ncbi:MAG: hypothetical protein AB7I50_04720 [Vicinamibacterales bacterium]
MRTSSTAGRRPIVIAILSVVAATDWLEACPLCFGAMTGSSEGAYRGMAVLLAVAIAVMAVTGAFVWRIAVRSRSHARIAPSWPVPTGCSLRVDVDG